MSSEPSYRPQHHFSARRNWINDPNGLIWHQGLYHLFFQYNPFGDQWGHMSWGHATSPDLMNWTEHPVAIPEDETASIFSGSIVADSHNTSGFGREGQAPLVAIYTAHLRRPEGGQRQDIAYSLDGGWTWTKYPGNPVLDLGLQDFRDPKVFWHQPTGRWTMVVVIPDARCAHLYASPNLTDWQFLSRIDAPLPGLGIWECPDLMPFEVPGEGTQWLFKVDVMEGHPSGLTGALLMMGDFDGVRFTPDAQTPPTWADWGADFYAALSWANLSACPARPGEHVWVAWMNSHAYARFQPTSPWRGAMSLPRTLSLRRQDHSPDRPLQLLQAPVPSLDALRGEPIAWHLDQVDETQQLDLRLDTQVRSWDIELAVGSIQEADPPAKEGGQAGLMIRGPKGEGVQVGWNLRAGTIFIDRSQSGWAPEEEPRFAARRQAPCPGLGQSAQRIRVVVDHCSVEVFVNDGDITLTELFFPTETPEALTLWAQGSVLKQVTAQAWPLAAASFAVAKT